MGFILYINILVIICVYAKQTEAASFNAYAKSLLAGLGDLDSSSSEAVVDKKAMKRYQKEIAKIQEKPFIKKHRKEMREQENDQVKFFDDLLSKIKQLKVNRQYPIE